MSHAVPKREVPVKVHLSDGRSSIGSVFLDYIDVIHRGSQTLLDKLNGDATWLPMREGSGIAIVNRARVVTVEPTEGMDPDLVRKDSAAVVRRESVSVRLIGERTLSGRIAMDLPDEFSRVSDFLNFPEDFFALETDHGPVLVSKQHVLCLMPHESPPAAPETPAERRGVRA